MENYKAKDRAAIIDYMSRRDTVSVKEIMDESGADSLRVLAILFELEQEGMITVTERGSFGNAVRVKFINK